VRLDAVKLLEAVDCQLRDEWLLALIADDEQVVSRAAQRVRVRSVVRNQEFDAELLDSDFALGVADSDLSWEWEYLVRVYRGNQARGNVTVWTREEDDVLAKRIAVMRSKSAGWGIDDLQTHTFVLSRMLVCEFTRSPRSTAESTRWETGGRPKYRDSQ
jgi:hypothetical protein